MPLCTSLFSMT